MSKIKRAIPLAASVVFLSHLTLADQVEETVVVADRVGTAIESLAVSVNVVDRELIDALGSATLPQLLRSQVGISATQTGGIGAVSGIRVRGQDAFRTRVLIDGIDISDPSSPQIAPRMEHILAGSLERVEISVARAVARSAAAVASTIASAWRPAAAARNVLLMLRARHDASRGAWTGRRESAPTALGPRERSRRRA